MEVSSTDSPGEPRLQFSDLSAAEQRIVREAQKRKKLAKAQAKEAKQRARAEATEREQQSTSLHTEATAEEGGAAGPSVMAGDLLAAVATYPSRISLESYFGACPGGGFRDPSLPPTEKSLALLMRVLQAGDEQAQSLNTCNYFQFSGSLDAVWDATFNARLAWEGFFTITTARRTRSGRGDREPLPELQPYYGVLTWPNFHSAKHVQTHVARLRRRLLEQTTAAKVVESDTGAGATTTRIRLCLEDNADRRKCWQHLEDYHNSPARADHGDNWLTEKYFEMMVAASDNPGNNFRMHTILMVEEELQEAEDCDESDGDEKARASEGKDSSSMPSKIIRCDPKILVLAGARPLPLPPAC